MMQGAFFILDNRYMPSNENAICEDTISPGVEDGRQEAG